MNEQIRLLEETLIATLNTFENVPIEAKRLILKEIYSMVEAKADEIISEEKQDAEKLSEDKLGELPQ